MYALSRSGVCRPWNSHLERRLDRSRDRGDERIAAAILDTRQTSSLIAVAELFSYLPPRGGEGEGDAGG